MQATIVINAAGCGSRLGKGIPKSLVHVGSRRIIDWQLREICQPSDRVKIVVGYMGDEVAAIARNLFPRIEVHYNAEWATTKTAASLSIAASKTAGRCLSLDGDLLVHPDDFRRLVNFNSDVVGITPVMSAQPVYVGLDDAEQCKTFSFQSASPWEWTGLVNFNPTKVPAGVGNVFEMMQCLLPVPTLRVRTVEVDTAEDLRQAPMLWSSLIKDYVKKGAIGGLAKNPNVLAG